MQFDFNAHSIFETVYILQNELKLVTKDMSAL